VKILVCSLEAPLPPVNGFRLQLGALIHELRGDHRVRVLALRYPDQTGPVDDDMRLLPRPSISTLGKVMALPRAALTRRPLGVAGLAARLRPALREELLRFQPDVVHVTPGELAMLGEDLSGFPTVLVPTDAWYLNVEADIEVASGIRKILLRRQAGWVRRFEGSRFRPFDVVVVVSDGDRDALIALDPSLDVRVIPNGVDAKRFSPGPFEDRDPDRVVFTGVMSYAPNVTAAIFLGREVMPLVREVRPSTRLSIVGRHPSPEVRALGGLDGVEVLGEVPDLGPWLRTARVYVCPMVSGTGIKNKLLEAMACGAPCVATPLAIRGTHVVDGREALIGTEPREVAGAVLRLLQDEGLARSLGEAARRYVAAEHAWPSAGRALERVYEDAVDHHRRRSRSASHTT
jgi:glycosyltransferase involved in cell wall biosynthesis